MPPGRVIILTLRIACVLTLIGHGWVCWNGHMPLRALLWDEGRMAGAVESLTGMEWADWASSMEVDAKINTAIRVQAVVFFAFAVAALIPFRRRGFGLIFLVATLNLALLVWLRYLDAGLGIGQAIEYGAQLAAPLALALVLFGCWKSAVGVALIGTISTFVGHGLFALDLPSETLWLNHPRPGDFTEMVMLCFGLDSEASGNRVLFVAGVLDLVAAAAILIRGWPRLAGLVYMVGWGFFTALARPWAYFEPSAAADTLNRWIPEALYRVPHFALPLFLLLALRRHKADIPQSQP